MSGRATGRTRATICLSMRKAVANERRLFDRLVATKRLDVSGIAGKWETSIEQVVRHPLPGVPRAFVIAGSDQRGRGSRERPGIRRRSCAQDAGLGPRCRSRRRHLGHDAGSSAPEPAPPTLITTPRRRLSRPRRRSAHDRIRIGTGHCTGDDVVSVPGRSPCTFRICDNPVDTVEQKCRARR